MTEYALSMVRSGSSATGSDHVRPCEVLLTLTICSPEEPSRAPSLTVTAQTQSDLAPAGTCGVCVDTTQSAQKLLQALRCAEAALQRELLPLQGWSE